MVIKRIAIYYSIAVGASMFLMWSFFVLAGMVP